MSEWSSDRVIEGPRSTQGNPKGSPGGPRRAQEGPRGHQGKPGRAEGGPRVTLGGPWESLGGPGGLTETMTNHVRFNSYGLGGPLVPPGAPECNRGHQNQRFPKQKKRSRGRPCEYA